MYNKRVIGNDKEQLVVKHLETLGYQVIMTNYFCQAGEIDIIAKENGYLVFIEVKYRSNLKNGYPEEAVTKRKMHAIIKTANHYLLRHGLSFDSPCRFDVAVLLKDDIKVYQNAFMIDEGYIF
ncbi:MAG: YraN family protein [bacterium]|nr:YraN family protein [bacterium]